MGTYVGVLQPAFNPTDPFSANSLGVFTIGLPADGASTGNFLMFTRGRVFGGTIQGVTDPNKATLSALINATFTYMLNFIDSNGMLQTISVTASVTGSLNAKVTTSTNTLTASSALLTGSATAFISNGGVQNNGDPTIDGTLSLDVMGFRQSTAAPSSGTLTPP